MCAFSHYQLIFKIWEKFINFIFWSLIKSVFKFNYLFKFCLERERESEKYQLSVTASILSISNHYIIQLYPPIKIHYYLEKFFIKCRLQFDLIKQSKNRYLKIFLEYVFVDLKEYQDLTGRCDSHISLRLVVRFHFWLQKR